LHRFHQGRFHGGPIPFGYRVRAGRLVIDEAEAEIVRWVFAEYLRRGEGHKQIARALTMRGVKPRRSERWSPGSVRRMLRNELYVGCRRYRVYEYARRPQRLGGPGCAAESAADDRLRIVDDLTFQAAQRQLADRAKRGMTPRQRLRRFSRLLYCGVCGSTYVRRWATDRPWYVQWGCGGRIRHGRDVCDNSAHVREHVLVDRVQRAIAHVFDRREAILAAAMDEAERELGGCEVERVQREQRLRRARRRLRTLGERLGSPALRGPAAESLIRTEIQRCTAELRGLEHERQSVWAAGWDRAELRAAVERTFDEARSSLAAVADDPEYNAFVRQWFGELLVHPDGRLSPRAPNAWSLDARGSVGYARQVVRMALVQALDAA
ncbi:MAG TPA: recombinase family protein, partial [Phycisphaerae bacterium]|nr:recombinase family protein [Phycisphaerae bacterium]